MPQNNERRSRLLVRYLEFSGGQLREGLAEFASPLDFDWDHQRRLRVDGFWWGGKWVAAGAILSFEDHSDYPGPMIEEPRKRRAE